MRHTELNDALVRLLSRKFIFAVLVVGLGFILVLTGRVDPKDWLGFVEVVGGTYVAANTVSKFTAK